MSDSPDNVSLMDELVVLYCKSPRDERLCILRAWARDHFPREPEGTMEQWMNESLELGEPAAVRRILRRFRETGRIHDRFEFLDLSPFGIRNLFGPLVEAFVADRRNHLSPFGLLPIDAHDISDNLHRETLEQFPVEQRAGFLLLTLYHYLHGDTHALWEVKAVEELEWTEFVGGALLAAKLRAIDEAARTWDQRD